MSTSENAIISLYMYANIVMLTLFFVKIKRNSRMKAGKEVVYFLVKKERNLKDCSLLQNELYCQ